MSINTGPLCRYQRQKFYKIVSLLCYAVCQPEFISDVHARKNFGSTWHRSDAGNALEATSAYDGRALIITNERCRSGQVMVSRRWETLPISSRGPLRLKACLRRPSSGHRLGRLSPPLSGRLAILLVHMSLRRQCTEYPCNSTLLTRR